MRCSWSPVALPWAGRQGDRRSLVQSSEFVYLWHRPRGRPWTTLAPTTIVRKLHAPRRLLALSPFSFDFDRLSAQQPWDLAARYSRAWPGKSLRRPDCSDGLSGMSNEELQSDCFVHLRRCPIWLNWANATLGSFPAIGGSEIRFG